MFVLLSCTCLPLAVPSWVVLCVTRGVVTLLHYRDAVELFDFSDFTECEADCKAVFMTTIVRRRLIACSQAPRPGIAYLFCGLWLCVFVFAVIIFFIHYALSTGCLSTTRWLKFPPASFGSHSVTFSLLWHRRGEEVDVYC